MRLLLGRTGCGLSRLLSIYLFGAGVDPSLCFTSMCRDCSMYVGGMDNETFVL